MKIYPSPNFDSLVNRVPNQSEPKLSKSCTKISMTGASAIRVSLPSQEAPKPLKQISNPKLVNNSLLSRIQTLESINLVLPSSPRITSPKVSWDCSTKEKALIIINRIKSNHATSELFVKARDTLKAHNGATLRLGFVAPEKAPYGSVAFTDKGIIGISSNLSIEEALFSAIFELCNIVQAPKIHVIYQKMLNGEYTREEYGQQMEETEYQSVCMHIDVVEKASQEIGTGHWYTLNKYRSFQSKAEHIQYQNDSGHTEYYHEQWGRYQSGSK